MGLVGSSIDSGSGDDGTMEDEGDGDVGPVCFVNEDEESCLRRYSSEGARSLLAAVQRCTLNPLLCRTTQYWVVTHSHARLVTTCMQRTRCYPVSPKHQLPDMAGATHSFPRSTTPSSCKMTRWDLTEMLMLSRCISLLTQLFPRPDTR